MTEAFRYTACSPERYTVNRHRYLADGRLVDLQNADGSKVDARSIGDLARFYAFCAAFDLIAKEGIAGSCAELGVYRGESAALIVRAARALGKTTYLLDSFEGFAIDDIGTCDGYGRLVPVQFQDTSLQSVRARIGSNLVKYVPGYFPASSAQLPDDGVYCLVHLDCDLHAPMKAGLAYFYPRLAPGGYLLMHDYGSLHWPGVEKALDEFFADKPESVVVLPDGAGTAVIRKTKPKPTQRCNGQPGPEARVHNGRWLSVGDAELRACLGAGWWAAEPWGVWGAGEAHELSVSLPAAVPGSLTVEMECGAALIGGRDRVEIDIADGSGLVDTWVFDRRHNLSFRSVHFSDVGECDAGAGDGTPTFRIYIRPRSVVAPNALDPTVADDRLLGLALHRLRLVFREKG